VVVAVTEGLDAEIDELGRATVEPTPRDTRATVGSMPRALTSILRKPLVQPRESERPIAKGTLGPGMVMSANAARTKVQTLAEGAILSSIRS
jgi:hypothetical protein